MCALELTDWVRRLAKLSGEDGIRIKALARRGSSDRELARRLGVTGGTVHYHRRRQAEGALDGAFGSAADCRAVLQRRRRLPRAEEAPGNVAEHGYLGRLGPVHR